MLVNVKLDVSSQKGLLFKVADFIGLVNFKWHSQNKVGNIVILILCRNGEKLYLAVSIYGTSSFPCMRKLVQVGNG